MFQHAGEHGIGEQPNILRKHAEDEPVDEMRDGLGIMAACAKPLRQAGELLRGFFRQRLAGFARLQPFRVTEHPFETLPLLRFMQIIEREFMNLLDRIGPVRMNAKPLHVANDQERRIFKGNGILLQLHISGLQVLMLALILPAEIPTLPDIRPAVAPSKLGRAALEAIPFPLGVGIRRSALFQQPAQVDEMLLGR